MPVPELEPLFLNELHKAAERAIVRIQEKLCERHELRRAVPPVAAVHKQASGVSVEHA